jgi:hypothetical protein
MSPEQWCARGRVDIQAQAGGRTLLVHRTSLRQDCSYRGAITIENRTELGSARRLRLIVRFAGDDALRATAAQSLAFAVA